MDKNKSLVYQLVSKGNFSHNGDKQRALEAIEEMENHIKELESYLTSIARAPFRHEMRGAGLTRALMVKTKGDIISDACHYLSKKVVQENE